MDGVSDPGLDPDCDLDAEAALLARQAFYMTRPQPCPYLPGRQERKIITRLDEPDDPSVRQQLQNRLSRAGFRRSHRVAYRPACVGCMACVPVRIAVAGVVEGRSARRLRRRNADLFARLDPARVTAEQFDLFERYQRARHADSDMASMTAADYRAMVEETPVATNLLILRHREGVLMGTMLVDRFDDGLSAIYSFFDTTEPARSLGTFMVQLLVEAARERRLPYVYLGYYVEESTKMRYKRRFQPLEALGPLGWQPFEPEPGLPET